MVGLEGGKSEEILKGEVFVLLILAERDSLFLPAGGRLCFVFPPDDWTGD